MVTSQDPRILVAEPVLQSLLPPEYKAELNAQVRMLNLLSVETPHLFAQQQFAANEWSILLALLLSHPYFASYETLLASLTSLPPSECRKILSTAQEQGSKMLKRELKPVHRALGRVRYKLKHICPYVKISLIREVGYALTTAATEELAQ